MTYTRIWTLSALQSGLTGTLGYTVLAADNSTVLIARSTAGITEDGTSAIYTAVVPNWDESWVGKIKWDAGAGTLGVDTFTANYEASLYALASKALPNVQAGQALGLPLLDSNLRLPANAVAWNGTTITTGVPNSGPVTVGGYSTGQAPPTITAIVSAVWTDLTNNSDFATAGSVGALVKTLTPSLTQQQVAGAILQNPNTPLANAANTGKVAATVATGDNADSAAIKATIGNAGAGLTNLPALSTASVQAVAGAILTNPGKPLPNDPTTGKVAVTLAAADVSGSFAGSVLTNAPVTPAAPTTDAVAGAVATKLLVTPNQPIATDAAGRVLANATQLAGQTVIATTSVAFQATVGTSTYAGADTPGMATLLQRLPGVVQPQTGDSYARLGVPATTSIAADVASRLAKADYVAPAAFPSDYQQRNQPVQLPTTPPSGYGGAAPNAIATAVQAALAPSLPVVDNTGAVYLVSAQFQALGSPAPPLGIVQAGSTASVLFLSGLPGVSYVGQHFRSSLTGEYRQIVSNPPSTPAPPAGSLAYSLSAPLAAAPAVGSTFELWP